MPNTSPFPSTLNILLQEVQERLRGKMDVLLVYEEGSSLPYCLYLRPAGTPHKHGTSYPSVDATKQALEELKQHLLR